MLTMHFERANDQDRTGDLIPTKDVLYQLSYTSDPLRTRAGDGARTRDPQLGRLMLYQLSYTRVSAGLTPAPLVGDLPRRAAPVCVPFDGLDTRI